MATQKKAVVPGMPLHALNAIKDESTRLVLQALVSAHDVRNGNAGKGDERFVTAAEVDALQRVVGAMQNSSKTGTADDVLLSPSDIGRIITELQAQVIESPLFKDLGERVDQIDKPGGIFDQLEATETALINETNERKTADTAEIEARQALGARVGTTEAGLVTEQQVRANADNAIVQSTTTQFTSVNRSLALVQTSVSTLSNSVSSVASQVNQVQAAVGANTTAIKTESTARATADGEINSKYTVKIDVNGYVSGYGLMATSNNSVPFSEFIVRADRFAIGSAAGPTKLTPKVPFIVTTADTVSGSEVIPAGVYIQDAFIKNASITSAKIGDAAVQTLKIAGNSVMTGVFDSGFSNSVPVSGSVNLITRTIDLGDRFNSGLIVSATVYCTADSNETIGFRILVNGVVAGDQRASMRAGFGTLFPASGFALPNSRFATVVLQAYDPGGGGHSPFSINASTMSIMGGKR